MRRIVIIEDDDTVIDLMNESLSEAGVDVEWQVARNGTDGMRWSERLSLESPIPDLLILDLNLRTMGSRSWRACVRAASSASPSR